MRPVVPEATRNRVLKQAQEEGVEVNLGNLDSLLRHGALVVGTGPDGRVDLRVAPGLYALCRQFNKRRSAGKAPLIPIDTGRLR